MFPNPFNSSLSIKLSSGGDFITNSVSIYSITGKKTQHWSIDNKNKKNNHILWGGKDERGFEIRSGLYFVRFKGPKKTTTRKITYLKWQKTNSTKHTHYSHYYQDDEIQEIKRTCALDIQIYGFSFDDRRDKWTY